MAEKRNLFEFVQLKKKERSSRYLRMKSDASTCSYAPVDYSWRKELIEELLPHEFSGYAIPHVLGTHTLTLNGAGKHVAEEYLHKLKTALSTALREQRLNPLEHILYRNPELVIEGREWMPTVHKNFELRYELLPLYRREDYWMEALKEAHAEKLPLEFCYRNARNEKILDESTSVIQDHMRRVNVLSIHEGYFMGEHARGVRRFNLDDVRHAAVASELCPPVTYEPLIRITISKQEHKLILKLEAGWLGDNGDFATKPPKPLKKFNRSLIGNFHEFAGQVMEGLRR